MSFENLHKVNAEALEEAVVEICSSLDVDAAKLDELTAYFIECMEKGLSSTSVGEEKTVDKGLPMIPTYVTSLPNGTERGVLLAADLGGTHFRVCSVTLNGDGTFDMQQLKSKIPEEYLNDREITSEELFSYLGRRTRAFVRKHHPELLKSTGCLLYTSRCV